MNTQNSLDELLDGLFSHEDDASFTCASRYRTCQECGQRYYFMNLHSKHPDAKKIDGSCDCSAKTDKAELEAAINKTIMECLPEKRSQMDAIRKAVEEDPEDEVSMHIAGAMAVGYNSALEDVRQQLIKKYGRAE